MEKTKFKQKWNEFKYKMRSKWDKLTDSDISEINGDYERFLNKMHKKHGYSREQAEREFHNWHMEGRTDHKEWNAGSREYGRREEGYGQKDSWHKEGDRMNEGHGKEKGSWDQKKNQKNQEPGKKGPRGWDEGNEKKRKAG
jgi:uncharacterized protein YjbJ (UPF0337 family)